MKYVICALAVLLTACGSDGKIGTKVSKTSEKYSYDFTDNGCKTNKQSSNSIDGLCRKLEDHALNNYCAYGMRAEEFKRYNCFAVLGGRPTSSEVEVTD